MAGLLDLLTGNQTQNSPQNGDAVAAYLGNLIDPATADQYARARAQEGLLGLSAGLLAGSGPSRLPVPFGSALGQGLMQMAQQQNALPGQALQAAQTGDASAQSLLRKIQGAAAAYQLSQMPAAYSALDEFNKGTTGGTGGTPGQPTDLMRGPVANAAKGDLSDPLALIRHFESSNNYFAGYGGADLSNAQLDQFGFPKWGGNQGPAGISHAAGAYQFEPKTWRNVVNKYFGGYLDFTKPENQDMAAQALYAEQGFAPWAPFNPRLAAAIKSGLGQGSPASGSSSPQGGIAANATASSGSSAAPSPIPASAGGGGGGPGSASVAGANGQTFTLNPAQADTYYGIKDFGQQQAYLRSLTSAAAPAAPIAAPAAGPVAPPGIAASGSVAAGPGLINVQAGTVNPGSPASAAGNAATALPYGLTPQRIQQAGNLVTALTRAGLPVPDHIKAIAGLGVDVAKATADANAKEAAAAGYAFPKGYGEAAGKGAGGAPYDLVHVVINGVEMDVPKDQYIRLFGGGAPGGATPQVPPGLLPRVANGGAAPMPPAMSGVPAPATPANMMPPGILSNGGAAPVVPPQGASAPLPAGGGVAIPGPIPGPMPFRPPTASAAPPTGNLPGGGANGPVGAPQMPAPTPPGPAASGPYGTAPGTAPLGIPPIGKPYQNPAYSSAVEGLTKEDSERMLKTIIPEADKARDMIDTATLIKDLLPQVRTGWAADSVAKGAKILSALGVSDDSVKDFLGTNPMASDLLTKKFLEQSAAAVRVLGAREPGSVITLFGKAYPGLTTQKNAIELMENVLTMQAKWAQDRLTNAQQHRAASIESLRNNGTYSPLSEFEAKYPNGPQSGQIYLKAAEAMSGLGDKAWRGLSRDQQNAVFAAIPSGSQYMRPDGKMDNKP